jgi:hypothetical protein
VQILELVQLAIPHATGVRRISIAVFALLLVPYYLRAQHVSCRTNYYTVTGSTVHEIHQFLPPIAAVASDRRA